MNKESARWQFATDIMLRRKSESRASVRGGHFTPIFALRFTALVMLAPNGRQVPRGTDRVTGREPASG